MADGYDYVIVGSGAAGATVASRLSEDRDATVLVLEAGPGQLPEAVDVPYRWNELLLTDLDWAYMSAPQPGLHDRQIYSASGRGMGGTSSVYHMMHMRGRPADYDQWAYDGCTGWSYNDVLPYLQRLEDQVDDTNPTAGRGGPVRVMNAGDMGNPVSRTFLDACRERGYPIVDDLNVDSFGAGWQHVDIRDGKRGGVVASYLRPALGRPNLTVQFRALATRLVISGGRCTGVEYVADGQTRTATADREVIVCAGAIQSPKLLMLSGLGDPAHLREHGIGTLVDLPGVGQNFHDHPLVIGPVGLMDRPGPDPKGNMTEVTLFWSSVVGATVPDLEVCLVHRAPFGESFFSRVVERMRTGQPVPAVADLVDPKLVLMLPSMVRPLSRGWVRLSSGDPTVAPQISANYGAEPTDIDRLTAAVEIARSLYRTRAFESWGMVEVSPGPQVADGSELREWVMDNTGSYYHFAGSCRMGIDRMAVVDPQLKVHGVDGLRVADASVMPAITSVNTHTTVVMIGERAADLVRSGAAASRSASPIAGR